MALQAPENELTQSKTITLTPTLWQFAKHVGRGNISRGIRFILQQALEKETSAQPGGNNEELQD